MTNVTDTYIISKEEFLERYKNVNFFFAYYQNYTFAFQGKSPYDNEQDVFVFCCRTAEDAYGFECDAQIAEKIYNLDPHTGICQGFGGYRFTTK